MRGPLTGEMYRQFAVTIAVSVAISGFVALTLSPALCRLLLKPHGSKKGRVERVLDTVLFNWFNRAFNAVTAGYTASVRVFIRDAVVGLLLFAALLYGTWHLFQKVPSGFVPDEDQGHIITVIYLPDGASMDRTDKVVRDVEKFYLDPSLSHMVEHTVTLAGLDLFAGSVNSTSAAVVFTCLEPWAERKAAGESAQAFIGRAWQPFGPRTDALMIAVNPPSIQGLGQRTGCEMQMQARAGRDVRTLVATVEKFTKDLSALPSVGSA